MSYIRQKKTTEPSLCIPRVFWNITEERVWNVLNELSLGEIERIDMVEKESRDGDQYKRVFIHFTGWNKEAQNVRDRLLNGEEIRIVYDDPWFWKVSASRSKRPRAPTERRPPRIEFSAPGAATNASSQSSVAAAAPRSGRASYTDMMEQKRVRHMAEAAATGMCGDAIMAAQHVEEEEEEAVAAATAPQHQEEEAVAAATVPPPPPPLTRQEAWASQPV